LTVKHKVNRNTVNVQRELDTWDPKIICTPWNNGENSAFHTFSSVTLTADTWMF